MIVLVGGKATSFLVYVTRETIPRQPLRFVDIIAVLARVPCWRTVLHPIVIGMGFSFSTN